MQRNAAARRIPQIRGSAGKLVALLPLARQVVRQARARVLRDQPRSENELISISSQRA
jgi:hypothetical protein